jgi:hypothetical protein
VWLKNGADVLVTNFNMSAIQTLDFAVQVRASQTVDGWCSGRHACADEASSFLPARTFLDCCTLFCSVDRQRSVRDCPTTHPPPAGVCVRAQAYQVGSVIANGVGSDLRVEGMYAGPYATLVTNVDVGRGTRPFGPASNGQRPASSMTFWNIRVGGLRARGVDPGAPAPHAREGDAFLCGFCACVADGRTLWWRQSIRGGRRSGESSRHKGPLLTIHASCPAAEPKRHRGTAQAHLWAALHACGLPNHACAHLQA